MMTRAEKFWDRIADSYDQTEDRFETLHVQAMEHTKKHLQAGHVVLDYGCATGGKAFELAGHVQHIQGIDISSNMIAGAQRNAAARNIQNVTFAQATLFDERYADESFDVVMAFNILHVLPDARQALRRIAELLKPGGLFISTTPCLREKQALASRLQLSVYLALIVVRLVPNILTRFTFADVDALFAGGSLQVIETRVFYHQVSSYFVVAQKIQGTENLAHNAH
ncbi:MAG: class I SAM-dependent methyltransferase [Chloroflexi bacterium]|nr:class I SAM-dependent methyltransferase [Chloroflexota bacterium]